MLVKVWYILIGAYLIIHIAVMTKYTAMPERTEWVAWLYTLQWLVPTLMLVLLVPRIQRLLNRVADLKVWTVVGCIAVSFCILTYFANSDARWFAWPTFGLLILLMVSVANNNARLGNVSAWLLGSMIALLAIGSWEVTYQTGLLAYYDFFGCGIMSYYVTVAMQFLWIIPTLIVVLVLYQRGLRLSVNRITLTCIGVSIAATALWFVNGMDIPLMWWQGPSGLEGPIVNEAARPWLISVSRGSQGFWLLGVTSLFLRRERGTNV